MGLGGILTKGRAGCCAGLERVWQLLHLLHHGGHEHPDLLQGLALCLP